MDNNKKLLAMELRQIVLADRMAADKIREAQSTADSIAQSAEQRRQAMLDDARQQKARHAAEAQKAQEQTLNTRRNALNTRFAAQREGLDAEMRAHQDTWANDIVRRILE